jgi:hypothetical protein
MIFFPKVTLEAHRTVIFRCILLRFHSNKEVDLSLQEQKTEVIYLISFYPILYSINRFLSQTFNALLKVEKASNLTAGKISHKFFWILIQQAKSIFSCKKSLKNPDTLLKITQNLHCYYFGLGSKFVKTKKWNS